MWIDAVGGFAAGVAIAAITTPVGVSGGVFLLPFQVSVLGVPSPAVTPTNLMFNVISVPGALARYRRSGSLRSPLTLLLVMGTLPGVVAGALIRVLVVPDGEVFRVLVALFLLPLGIWLLLRDRHTRPSLSFTLADRQVILLGLTGGLIGGIYGIGGGSLLAPILTASGYLVTVVAPAALVSTFLTSCVGAATYGALAIIGHSAAAPDWPIAISCGIGGLFGGYIGAALQPHLPTRLLTRGLGAMAVLLSVSYIVATVT